MLNATLGVLFVVALTLYFVSSMELMKRGLYALVPASKEMRFREIAEEIFSSVGKYLNRMFLLAIPNGLFTFFLLTIVGNPYSVLLAVFAVPITFIPIVGSVINTAHRRDGGRNAARAARGARRVPGERVAAAHHEEGHRARSEGTMTVSTQGGSPCARRPNRC